MRKCLKNEGWLEDSTLPVNWFYRSDIDGGKSVQFIDATGDLFKNSLAVMKKYKDESIIQALNTFMEKQTPVYNGGKEIDGSWATDPTVPPGWMIKSIGGLTNSFHVLSPDKRHFTGRRKALEFIVKNNYPKDQIEAMRKCLEHDGWIEDPRLPTNWLYKSRDGHNSHFFLDEFGTLYKSIIQVLSKQFNRKYELHFKRFSETKSKYSGNTSSEYWTSNDPTVPPGWMTKKANNSALKGSIYLLSPENHHFQGRRPALKFMIEQNFPDEKIEEMRRCFKHDGWLEDETLPLNWFYKAEGGKNSFQFINPKGELIKNTLNVLRNTQDESVIAAINMFTGKHQSSVYN